VGLRPGDERLDGGVQGGAQRRERVLHARRHDGVHGALDQAVALELAQGHGQHPLADPVHQPLELGEAQRPVLEQRDHQQRPLVGDPVEDLTNLASLAHVPLDRVIGQARSRAVLDRLQGAVFHTRQ